MNKGNEFLPSGLSLILLQAWNAENFSHSQSHRLRLFPIAVLHPLVRPPTRPVVGTSAHAPPTRACPRLLAVACRSGVSWAHGFGFAAGACRGVDRPTDQRGVPFAAPPTLAVEVVRENPGCGVATARRTQPPSPSVLSGAAVGGIGRDRLRVVEHPADRARAGQGGEPSVSRGVRAGHRGG